MSSSSFASLDEVWQDGFGSDVSRDVAKSKSSRNQFDVTAPTCNYNNKQHSTNSPWCDLYYQGYSSEIDNIMDMYTPGDQIPAEVRYIKKVADVVKTTNQGREPDVPQVIKKTVRTYDREDSITADNNLARMSSRLFEEDDASTPLLPFGATAYDPGTTFAPYLDSNPNPNRNSNPTNSNPNSNSNNPTNSNPNANSKPSSSPNTRSADVSSTNEGFQELASRENSRKMPKRRTYEEDAEEDDDAEFYDYARPRSEQEVNTTRGGRNHRKNRHQQAEDISLEETYTDNDASTTTSSMTSTTTYLELALYVFSGILLIFVMEQFVQIGLHMR
jgi:hypothetical protein